MYRKELLLETYFAINFCFYFFPFMQPNYYHCRSEVSVIQRVRYVTILPELVKTGQLKSFCFSAVLCLSEIFTRVIPVRVKKEYFFHWTFLQRVKMLTKAEGRASLLHILKKLRQLQKSAAYQEAESQCGNDMLKRVQLIYPLVIRAEMNAVTDYGFTASFSGLSKYMHEIYALSGEDKEVERLMSEVRSMIFPELPLPDATAALPL
ncbi:Protein C10 [Trichinella zimbabwensis]|uniref:Protein C10 n=1 Tax=Trichinella zimbabwensis TaxID=268475 RepID=A0A0V1H837_9BILA|nr:Protein C10 [Trichinella zimbabwensis]